MEMDQFKWMETNKYQKNVDDLFILVVETGLAFWKVFG